jgi:hypothetical protein
VAESSSNQQNRVVLHTDVNVLNLIPGQQVKLEGDIIAEVVENMGDGLWIRVKYLSIPGNSSLVGAQEQVFATDVVAVA